MKNFLTGSILIMIFYSSSAQDKMTDARDGNVYHTVTVNGITWMKENLRFTGLPGVFFFDNDKNNLPLYGALYEWKTAMQACPSGWHLPTGQAFQNLLDYYDQKDSWGKGPSDPEAFNIQLGGQQDYEGIFSEMDESGYYWTATEYDNENAEYFSYLLIIDKHVIDISRKADIGDIHGSEKINRYSIRCIKD